MGKLTVIIDDNLETQLRVAIAQKGGKRGDLKIALEEAIKLWLQQQNK
jgi:hypothetical protein